MDPLRKNPTNSLSRKIILMIEVVLILSSCIFCTVSIINSRIAIRRSIQQRMLDIANCASGSVDGDVLETLTAEDAASLSQAMIDTAKIAEMFIASSVAAGMKPDQGAPGVVNNLQGMLSRDFEFLK